jgi:trans-aconitate methyltransferase
MRQLIRYGLVGGISNIVMYLFYLLITSVGFEPKIAMTLVYIIGASIGFVGNRKWTFSYNENLAGNTIRYILAHLFGYLLNFLMLLIFVDNLGFAHQWVQAISILIVAGFLFIVFKYFVFREKNIVQQENTKIGFKAHYFKELAELEGENFWFRSRNKLILWALSQYSPKMKSFLEIGCGTGFVISAISTRFPKTELLGSEYFEEGLAYARQRLPSVEFTQMDARSIPYDLEIDCIGAFDVLEHIKEDEVVLQQINKALKPGGILLITVPQHRWLWSAVDEYACHVRRYSANELNQKVSNAGFEVVRSTSFVSLLLPAMYVSRLLKRNNLDVNVDAMAELRTNFILNKFFEYVLYFELALIRLGLNLPLGGSRLLVARKPIVKGS